MFAATQLLTQYLSQRWNPAQDRGERRIVGRSISGRVALVVSLCVLCGGLTARAQESGWKVRRGPAPVPAAVAYGPELLKETPKEYLDDYPACCLYSGVHSLVAADGATEDVYHTLVRLNTMAAVEEQGECRLWFEPDYQTVTLHVARVHKPDGEIIEVRPEHVQVRDANTDYQVYSTTREVVVSFPGLGVGDVLELQWSTAGRDPEFAPQFVAAHGFSANNSESADLGASSCPTYLSELRVRIQKDRVLKHASYGRDIEPKTVDEDVMRTYRWEVRNLLPAPHEDSTDKEPYLVGVSCSTFSSWEAVAKWELELRKSCRECNKELRGQLDAVTKDCKTTEQKVRALCRWMRSDVRYLSHGHGPYGNRPHAPALVMANRFGDCKDKTQLLAVLMDELKIPYEFVLTMAAGEGQMLESVPSPVADHIFLRINVEGTWHWVDPTGTYNAWDQLRDDCCNRAAFFFNDTTARFGKTPEMLADDYFIDTTTQIAVQSSGAAKLTVERRYTGLAAAELRTIWASLPRNQRKEHLAHEQSNFLHGARITDLKVDEKQLADPDEPLDVQFSLETPKFFGAAGSDGEHAAEVSDTSLWDVLLQYRTEADRAVPIDLPLVFETRTKVRITLPPTHVFAGIPAADEVTSKWGRIGFETKYDEDDPRHLTLTWKTRLDSRHVSAADLPKWRTFEEEVSTLSSSPLQIGQTTDPADIDELRREVRSHPDDTAAWQALVELLAGDEQVEKARKLLAEARKHLPEDRRLAELEVTLTTGKAEIAAAWAKVCEQWPDVAEYKVRHASALIALDKLDEAEPLLGDVADDEEAGKWKCAARVKLAEIRLLQRKFGEGHALLDAALETDLDALELVDLWRIRGALFEKEKKWEEASRNYARGLLLHPASLPLHAGTVRTALKLDDRDAALAALWRFSAGAETAAELLQAAEFHVQLERWDDAGLCARKALAEDPSLKRAAEINSEAQKHLAKQTSR